MTGNAWQRALRVLWTVLLVAMLAAVVALNRSLGARRGPGASPSDALARYGFQLEERAAQAGVAFVHQGPTFDRRLDHIMPQVASMGAAVAVSDFNRDVWQDFYVTNSGEGSLNRLYRNVGNGTFQDVATELGAADVNRAG